jgi:hypothetical protein
LVFGVPPLAIRNTAGTSDAPQTRPTHLARFGQPHRPHPCRCQDKARARAAMPSCRRSSANAFEVREGVGLQRALPLRHMLGVLQLACRIGGAWLVASLKGAFQCAAAGRGTVNALRATISAPHALSGAKRWIGGAGGIRTLDRALQPYNGLAMRVGPSCGDP